MPFSLFQFQEEDCAAFEQTKAVLFAWEMG